eukprot:g932.t1
MVTSRREFEALKVLCLQHSAITSGIKGDEDGEEGDGGGDDNELQVGDKVQALYQGGNYNEEFFYPGQITAVCDGGNYNIEHADGTKTEQVKLDSIISDARLLRKHGAREPRWSVAGLKALVAASCEGDTDTIRHLLACDTDCTLASDAANAWGAVDALFAALSHRHDDAVRLLTAVGVSAAGGRGAEAMLCASASGDVERAKMLLDCGAPADMVPPAVRSRRPRHDRQWEVGDRVEVALPCDKEWSYHGTIIHVSQVTSSLNSLNEGNKWQYDVRLDLEMDPKNGLEMDLENGRPGKGMYINLESKHIREIGPGKDGRGAPHWLGDAEGARPLEAASAGGHTAVVRMLLAAGAAVEADSEPCDDSSDDDDDGDKDDDKDDDKDAQDKDGEDDPKLRVGEIVEGNYRGKGRWYKGTIKRLGSSSEVTIEYDDGEVEDDVSQHNVRRPGADAKGSAGDDTDDDTDSTANRLQRRVWRGGAGAALAAACSCGHAAVARLLLDAGASVKGRAGARALYLAARRGSPEAVHTLVAAGARLAGDAGAAALAAACELECAVVATSVVRALLGGEGAEGGGALQGRHLDGTRAVAAAIEAERWDLLRVLVQGAGLVLDDRSSPLPALPPLSSFHVEGTQAYDLTTRDHHLAEQQEGESVGTRADVLARMNGSARYYLGRVRAANGDGTYDVAFGADRHRKESGRDRAVPGSSIRLLADSAARALRNASATGDVELVRLLLEAVDQELVLGGAGVDALRAAEAAGHDAVASVLHDADAGLTLAQTERPQEGDAGQEEGGEGGGQGREGQEEEERNEEVELHSPGLDGNGDEDGEGKSGDSGQDEGKRDDSDDPND